MTVARIELNRQTPTMITAKKLAEVLVHKRSVNALAMRIVRGA